MSASNVFSVPIFLIILRESIEAGIIVSILLSFVKKLILDQEQETLPTVAADGQSAAVETSEVRDGEPGGPANLAAAIAAAQPEDVALTNKQLYRKLVLQIWLGTGIGFGIALAIGAAFIAIFYTKLQDLWAQTEDAWEGAFSLLAAGLILVMGVAFLKLEGSSAKWRIHLSHAFQKGAHDKSGRGSRYALLFLPMITVLREGLEAIVFVGGVSLAESATSIPLAVFIGLVCGGIVSYLIYKGGAVMAIRYFLIVSTCILFLIGAGLFSKSIWYFQEFIFVQGVGADLGELGDGPGSFNAIGMVWHLTWGNPENPQTGGGWSIFNAILGWQNTATVGSIVSYCAYWILVIIVLCYLKWSEGRGHILGIKSGAYHKRQIRLQERARNMNLSDVDSDEKASLESPA